MGISWSQSGTVARDNNDARAEGALAYFYVGGTTTPLAVYEDAAEGTPHDFPVPADGDGRWPNIFIPYTASFDVKVTTAGGTQLFYFLEIPNPDPVDVAVGAVTTSSTQLLQTGDWLFNPKSGTRTGFVRANGRTVGSGASGATERANADCSDLYAYLWNNFTDSILAVTTGRGGSAAADFAANKPIALFDCRGAGPRGLDDMGNTAKSALTAATFTTGSAIIGGSLAGENTHALITGELASHSHTVGTLVNAAESTHTHGIGTYAAAGESAHTHGAGTLAANIGVAGPAAALAVINGSVAVAFNTGATGNTYLNTQHSAAFIDTGSWTGATAAGSSHTHTLSGSSAAGSSHNHTISGSTASSGSGTAHNNVPYSILGNWLIKI